MLPPIDAVTRDDLAYLRAHGRNARGWVVTLINNRGVYKPQQGLAQVNRAESAEVTLGENGASFKRAAEWTTGSELKVNGGTVSLSVPAGGVRIVELLP